MSGLKKILYSTSLHESGELKARLEEGLLNCNINSSIHKSNRFNRKSLNKGKDFYLNNLYTTCSDVSSNYTITSPPRPDDIDLDRTTPKVSSHLFEKSKAKFPCYEGISKINNKKEITFPSSFLENKSSKTDYAKVSLKDNIYLSSTKKYSKEPLKVEIMNKTSNKPVRSSIKMFKNNFFVNTPLISSDIVNKTAQDILLTNTVTPRYISEKNAKYFTSSHHLARSDINLDNKPNLLVDVKESSILDFNDKNYQTSSSTKSLTRYNPIDKSRYLDDNPTPRTATQAKANYLHNKKEFNNSMKDTFDTILKDKRVIKSSNPLPTCNDSFSFNNFNHTVNNTFHHVSSLDK